MKKILSNGHGHRARTRVMVAMLAVLVILCISGCDSCVGKRSASSGTPHAQSPAAPLSAPARQTPVSPVVPPPAPPSGTVGGAADAEPPQAAEDKAAPKSYSPEVLLNIKPGMSYEEVQQALGDPGMIIAGTDQENSVYRWSNSGISFMGRFENGRLIRKNMIAPEYGERLPDEDTMQFDRDLFDTITPGMRFEDVLAIIGMDAQPLSPGNNKVKLYKWTDLNGSSITARFEDQVLVRKSGVIVEPESEATAEEAEESRPDDTEEDSYPVEEAVEDDYVPVPVQPTRPPVVNREASETAPQQARIHVVGAKRREREIAEDPSPFAGRSYRPEVKLPEYKRSLRSGSYRIHIHNTTTSRADVAIISDEGGLELSVGPESHALAHVKRGTYQFYFIYEDAPYTLHQGQRIPVEELLTDFAVYLFDDSSRVDLF